MTRYGNVMYSRGSVIPLFVEQSQAGQPLTVTDPAMTRFLMSLDESVDLVEHAFAARPARRPLRPQGAGRRRSTCWPRRCAAVRGAEPEIKIIGTRHGEKLHETLASREEMAKAEDQGDYFRVPLDGRDLNYSLYFDEGDVEHGGLADFHSHNARRLSVPEIESLLLTLPEVRAQVQAAAAAVVTT